MPETPQEEFYPPEPRLVETAQNTPVLRGLLALAQEFRANFRLNQFYNKHGGQYMKLPNTHQLPDEVFDDIFRNLKSRRPSDSSAPASLSE